MAVKKYKKTIKTETIAGEPGVPYVRQTQAPVFFFNNSFQGMGAFEKINLIKAGISKKELEEIKKTAGLDYDQLAEVLSVTRATLINKKGKDKFGGPLSERIIGVADVYAYGYEVFEDKAAFNRWVHMPNRALGGIVPYSLLDNQYGREEVKNIIGRISYGVYS